MVDGTVVIIMHHTLVRCVRLQFGVAWSAGPVQATHAPVGMGSTVQCLVSSSVVTGSYRRSRAQHVRRQNRDGSSRLQVRMGRVRQRRSAEGLSGTALATQRRWR